MGTGMIRTARILAVIASVLLFVRVDLNAQARGTAGAQAQTSAKASAPIDLTGYWVAEVTEDWRWRMVTPAKGDYLSIPINPAAEKVADAWDPAKDDAAGEQCKSYGPPGLMRAPTRLNITWEDDNTLKVQTDYGTQTRLLHFGNWTGAGGPATLQGDSKAHWEMSPARGGGPKSGTLVSVTTHLRPGYLRKNGVPYSADTVYTEYWDVVKEKNGDQRILLLSVVDDPKYLREPWTVPLHFKKEPNGAKWDTTPCSSTW
jgi:hypothetical protein